MSYSGGTGTERVARRSPRVSGLLMALCFVLPLGLMSSTATGEDVTPPPVLEELAEKASELRELPVKEPIKYGQFADREELEEFINQYFDESFPEELLGPLNRTYRRLGLAEMNEEFRQGYTDMVVSQVAGLYDYLYEQKMYIIWDLSPDIWMVQTIFIHEIVHALQDQHFDLKAMPLDDLTNDDAASAAQALIEGDATYTMMMHQPEQFDPMSLSAELFLTQILTSAEFEGVGTPYILQARMFFAYLRGQGFVKYLYEHGDGFETVNAAYADPPTTTEQVLHPEKYLTEERDVPTPIEIPDVTGTLGGNWELVYHNTLGELGINAMLETELILSRAIRAAEGWDGDWYGLFEPEDGGSEGVLVLESVWDSEEDAQQFHAALTEYSAEKAGGDLGELADDEVYRLAHGEGHRLIVRANDRVLMLDGPPEDLEKIAALYGERYPNLNEGNQ